MKVSIQILPNARGGYTALCLSLPGCAAQADTREQARRDLEEAIKGYLAAVNNFVPANLAEELVEV
ncbi:MAG TPA: type II toxin-antitoxin system HicB family antitoxin [Phycisphaerae bacterium]|nr:type II toxin-antitoxin system HicB family antitoxin [Phycisphaerae bacterium]